MYLKESVADVHFDMYTKDCERKLVPAHKFVLAKHSPVFRQMFEPSKDKELDDEVFEIREYLAEQFEEFLQIFYLQKVGISDNCFAVVRLAEEYGVLELLKPIYRWFQPIITPENAVNYCKMAILLDREDLKERCLRKMQERITEPRRFELGARRAAELNIMCQKQMIISKLLAYRVSNRNNWNSYFHTALCPLNNKNIAQFDDNNGFSQTKVSFCIINTFK